MKEVKLLVKNKKLGGHIVFSEGIYQSDERDLGKKMLPTVFNSDPYDKVFNRQTSDTQANR
jgi:hypothetical protein